MEIFVNDLTFMESIIDNRLMKLNYQFDRLMMEHKENIHSIETKVLMENGTDEDLCTLYTMEAEEVKEKGQGVLVKIISAVKNFFKKLRETLFGKKIDENDLDEQVEVPDDPDAVLKDGNNLLSQIKGFISGHKVQIAVGAAATAGAVVLTKKKIIPYTRDLEKYLENQEKVLADASNPEVLAKLNPEQQEILKSAVNKVKGNGSRVSKIMQAIRSKSGKGNDDYEEIRHYKKNMDDARQREDARKREARQAEKDAWKSKTKDEKIQDQSQRTRSAILQQIEDLQKKDLDDKLLIKNRAKDIDKIEKKSGDKSSFAKWFGLNKHTKEGERIAVLKKKLDSGEISGSEVDEYSRLVVKHGQSSGEMTAELNKAKAEMQAAIKRRAATAEQIKKLSAKVGRAVKQQGEAAERQAAHVQADAATHESVEELICSANSEVDYFINHVL